MRERGGDPAAAQDMVRELSPAAMAAMCRAEPAALEEQQRAWQEHVRRALTASALASMLLLMLRRHMLAVRAAAAPASGCLPGERTLYAEAVLDRLSVLLLGSRRAVVTRVARVRRGGVFGWLLSGGDHGNRGDGRDVLVLPQAVGPSGGQAGSEVRVPSPDNAASAREPAP